MKHMMCLLLLAALQAQACETLDAAAEQRLSRHMLTIVAAARTHDVPPSLAIAVAQHESCFQPYAVSNGGAMGLMQIRPPTFKAYGAGDIFNPTQSARAGAKYLQAMYRRFGSWELALAAYNAGPTAVQRAGGRLPKIGETRAYVRKVMTTAYQMEVGK